MGSRFDTQLPQLCADGAVTERVTWEFCMERWAQKPKKCQKGIVAKASDSKRYHPLPLCECMCMWPLPKPLTLPPILTPPTPPPQPNPTPRQLLPPNSILACSSLEKTLALKLNPVPKLTTALELNPYPKPSSSKSRVSLLTIAWTWALSKIGNCLEVLLSEKIKKNKFKSLTYLRELSQYSLFPPP